MYVTNFGRSCSAPENTPPSFYVQMVPPDSSCKNLRKEIFNCTQVSKLPQSRNKYHVSCDGNLQLLMEFGHS